MNFKSLFAVAALGTVMVACSNEEPVVSTPDNTIQAEGNLIAFNVQTSDGTRAITFDDPGSDAEKAVNDVAVALYLKENGSDDIECKVVFKSWDTTSENKFITNANGEYVFNIHDYDYTAATQGTWYAVAFVNANATSNTAALPAEGDKYATYNKTVTNFANNDNTAFFMTSALMGTGSSDLTALTEVEMRNIYTTSEEVNSVDQVNSCATINVERVAAKVSLTWSENSNICEWVYNDLEQTADKSFAIHTMTDSGDYFGNSFFGTNKSYLWGTNCTGITLSDLNELTAKKEVMYCHENIVKDVNDFTAEKLTRLVIKAQYKPSSVESDGTFYVFRGVCYNEEDLETAAGITVDDSWFTSSPVHFVTGKGNVTKYDGGMCYYTIYIKHFPTTLPDPWTGTYNNNQFGRFSVVRNNWYAVNVTAVNGPGAPEMPDGDTTPDPVEEEESNYIEYTISVLNWAKHTQNEEL